MIRVGKMSWREISAMLGSCCSSMLFGLSFMFTKRIVGTVPAFSLLSWRFLMGAVAMSLCALLGVIHIDYKTKKPWPLLRMTLVPSGGLLHLRDVWHRVDLRLRERYHHRLHPHLHGAGLGAVPPRDAQ